MSLFLMVMMIGCKKDKDLIGIADDSINQWIYRQMSDWYLWADELPEDPDYTQSSSRFYNSLLVPQDRFSFFYEDYQELINYLNGVTLDVGFEFKLFLDRETPGGVLAVVLYVKKGTEAESLGLRRGDIIRKINNQTITESNFGSLLDDMQSTFTLSRERYDSQGGLFVPLEDLQITPAQLAENPFHLDTILYVEGQKIGYLVYNFFSTGSTERSSEYAQQMDEIFGRFKNEMINHLVLDLRYNSGGDEISLRDLASYVLPGEYQDQFVLKKKYNEEINDLISNDPNLGENFINIHFTNPVNSVGDLLNDKVYIISSDRTASASEALINALNPFMDLFIVGDTTVGKDVGSTTLYDEAGSGSRIGLQPIVVQVTNNEDHGYPNGFFPDIPIEESYKSISPLGSINDPLLRAVINEISPLPTRIAFREKDDATTVATSIMDRGLVMKPPR